MDCLDNSPWFYNQSFQDELERTFLRPETPQPEDPFIGVTEVYQSPPYEPVEMENEFCYSDGFLPVNPFDELLNEEDMSYGNFIDVESSPSPPSLQNYDQFEEKPIISRIPMMPSRVENMEDIKPTIAHRPAPSRRGRPQKDKPRSLKAQVSKHWREKKKVQDKAIQDKVMQLECENTQLARKNNKLQTEIQQLRQLVARLQKA